MPLPLSQLRTRPCNCIVPDPSVTDQNQTIFPTITQTKEQKLCELPCGPVDSSYDSNELSIGDGETEFGPCSGMIFRFFMFQAFINDFNPYKAADDAKWDEWQEWGACSATAGLGNQTRTHLCTSLGCASSNDCTSICSDGFELIKSGASQMCVTIQKGRFLFQLQSRVISV